MFSGKPDAGNLPVRFEEGRGGSIGLPLSYSPGHLSFLIALIAAAGRAGQLTDFDSKTKPMERPPAAPRQAPSTRRRRYIARKKKRGAKTIPIGRQRSTQPTSPQPSTRS